MADYTKIIPFIKQAEGGFSDNPNDAGGATMQGITLTTFQQYYPGTTVSDLKAITPDEWAYIFKKGFWDAVCGDAINSQRIAEELAEWAWGSGRYYPSETLQTILQSLGYNLTADGCVGSTTVMDINAANEVVLFKALVLARVKFIAQIVVKNSMQLVFIQGWLTRLVNLLFTEVTV